LNGKDIRLCLHNFSFFIDAFFFWTNRDEKKRENEWAHGQLLSYNPVFPSFGGYHEVRMELYSFSSSSSLKKNQNKETSEEEPKIVDITGSEAKRA